MDDGWRNAAQLMNLYYMTFSYKHQIDGWISRGLINLLQGMNRPTFLFMLSPSSSPSDDLACSPYTTFIQFLRGYCTRPYLYLNCLTQTYCERWIGWKEGLHIELLDNGRGGRSTLTNTCFKNAYLGGTYLGTSLAL